MSRRYRTVSVEVDVEADYVLDELSDDDLVEEIKSRKVSVTKLIGADNGLDGDWLDRLRWFLLHRDTSAALAMVESALVPAQALAARMTSEAKQETVQ